LFSELCTRMNALKGKPPRTRHGAVAAMFLGTALSALGAATPARAEAPDGTVRIVNDMSRYCTVCWRNARLHPDHWSDCTQEVFSRMLERVSPQAWEQALRGEGEEHREFLRAIDAVKKRTQRALRRSRNLNDVVPDGRDGVDQARTESRDAVRRAAAELLSPRQQRIVQMSFDGWSVNEIATQLHIPAERVSDEKYKAIRKLRVSFCQAE
jgi:RNA polymerase sigma factor (sigma-70 family)